MQNLLNSKQSNNLIFSCSVNGAHSHLTKIPLRLLSIYFFMFYSLFPTRSPVSPLSRTFLAANQCRWSNVVIRESQRKWTKKGDSVTKIYKNRTKHWLVIFHRCNSEFLCFKLKKADRLGVFLLFVYGIY